MRRLDRLVADYPDSYKLTGPKAAVIYGKPV